MKRREPVRSVQKTDEEWRAALTNAEYEVMRHKGTERAFTGEYWNVWEDGTYHCRSCGAELFKSETKFDAGCGWPSFSAPSVSENVEEHKDVSFGMIRTEVVCHQCGAHLGHVFNDGPAPTGLRYCINSVSIKLEPDASSD